MSIQPAPVVLGKSDKLPSRYPEDLLPTLLRNVVRSLNEDTEIPAELIASTVLSAISLACQSLIQVIPPHDSRPEQCSLYFLTLAESGEGKSTIHKRIMEPFHEFISEMELEYEAQEAEYKKRYSIWKIRKRALDANLVKAIKNNETGISEDDALNEHADTEPSKPKLLNILYEDVTPAALVQGLSEYPYAALMSDEAITFFKGFAKDNLGLLNKAWGGETYYHNRADGRKIGLKACLTFSLMVQPGIFSNYLEKHGELAESSGFLSRMLFTNTKSSIGYRTGNSNHKNSDEATAKLHEKISLLLDKQKRQFYTSDFDKKTLKLSLDAEATWREYRDEIERSMHPSMEQKHIKSIASKSGSNAVRLAAMLQYIQDENAEEITKENLEDSYKIVEWHFYEAKHYFYPMSEDFIFEQNVYELFSWINDSAMKKGKQPLKVNEIQKFGPNKLRRVKELKPILEQLVYMGLICIFKYPDNPTHFIARSMNFGFSYIEIPSANAWVCQIVSSRENILGRKIDFDYSQLQWG